MISRSGSPWFVALAAAGAIFVRPRLRQKCLRGVNSHEMMTSMENTTERLVLVPMTQLDDLLELARHAIERLPEGDPLRWSLTGSVSAVRSAATAEP
jgi:hypothetical protein